MSVILPTYNRLTRLKMVLDGLEKQTYPQAGFEVIVVSDGSSDGTDEFLHQYKSRLRLTAVFQPNQGVAATRNHGLQKATGDLVLFIDDDVIPAPQLIAEHVSRHEQYGRFAVVMGPMLTPDDFQMKPWVQWEQAMLMKQYDDMAQGRWQPTARQFYTGNTSLAREHLLAVGGFDANFRRAEDVELAYRLADRGLRFFFNADAVGYHYAERSFASWLAIPYVYGRNDVIFTRDKGQSWLLPTIAYEFRHTRNALIKKMTRLCLDHPVRSRLALFGCKYAALLGHYLGDRQLPRMGYSAIFNLRHYQGIADELGGRDQFFALVAQATTPVGPPQPAHELQEFPAEEVHHIG
ncbi:MAG: glycosyltransferase family 2 protein [Anaerolineales bacterium]|nr:glycosyltransferase family 2 protein [Anaerolineales bacterium]